MKITEKTFLFPAVLLLLLLTGWNLPGSFFSAAACAQAFSLPVLTAAAALCAGACTGGIIFRFCTAVRKPLGVVLATALLITLSSRTMRAFSFEIYSGTQCVILYIITYLSGFLSATGALLLKQHGCLSKAAAGVIAGALLRLAAEISPSLLPITTITTTTAVITAVIAALQIATGAAAPGTKAFFAVCTAAIVTVILFVPITGTESVEKIFTLDGWRIIDSSSPATYTVYAPDGSISAYSPADYFAVPALLPATLQSDNHNLQTVMSVSPASLLINTALQMPRIAAVDHISGDPELAAANQSHIITTAEINRFDKISQLRGPYDLAIVTEGDPNDFIPFLSSRGVLAVDSTKAAMISEDAFKYCDIVSGAGYFVLFSNAPLTTDWEILQKRYDNYDGKLRNFPAGILASLYRWAPPAYPPMQTIIEKHYTPAQKMPFTPAGLILPAAVSVLAAILLKILANRKLQTKILLQTFSGGILTALGTWAALESLENMAIPLFYQGFALFLPLSLFMLFPSGISTSKYVYMLLPATGCMMLFAGFDTPSLMMTGGILLCAVGCRPLPCPAAVEGATACTMWSAGAVSCLVAIWLTTVSAKGIFVLLPLLLTAL
jgi:hypothetical protein